MTIENNAGIAPVRAAAPPRLVIDARTSTTDGIDPGYRLLGLALVERIALAARHCGFGRIYVLTRDGGNERLRRLLARVDGANVGASFPEDGEAEAHTVGVNGLILGERNWLEAAAGAAPPDHGIFTLGTGAVIGGRKVTLARVAAALSGSTPSKTFTLPAEAPLIIRFEADLAAAEKRLLRSLGKASEGFMERRFERPISVRISRVLASTPVTPNQVTLLAAATGLLAAPFFLSAAPLWQSCGALLFVAHAILDSCDGPLARLRFEVSRRGGLLDFWCDNAVHMVIFGCMAAGWSREIGAGWPLALGASAILGTLGSASFVFWRVMRPKRGEGLLYDSVAKGAGDRLTALLDALSRRDFIYLVLIFSLPGEATWFLALAAVGAPIFFVMLLVAAAQERRRN